MEIEASHDVYAQRYNAAGEPQGGEFRVNSFTNNNQKYPAVAMDADGDFVIAWMSQDQDGDGWGIYAQRYNAAGEPQGGELRVNTWTTDDQDYPAVAMDAAGNFVVAWTSYAQDGDQEGVFARWYDASGTPAREEFQVNIRSAGWQTDVAVATDRDDQFNHRFVVTWDSYAGDGSPNGVYAQLCLPDGTRFWAEDFLVSDAAEGWGSRSSTAMDATGAFVVAWEQWSGAPEDDFIFARHFDPNGDPQPPIPVAAGNCYQADVAMDAGGDFLVSWHAWDDLTGDAVYARAYDRYDVPLGAAFRVNSFEPDSQDSPAVAMDGNGNAVIVWSSWGQDGSEWGVYAQRYDAWTHTAPPLVGGVYLPEGEPVLEWATVTSCPQQLVITFSEDLPALDKPNVVDPANWSLTGIFSPGELISYVDFYFNAWSNRYEAILYLAAPLCDDMYTLTARSVIHDLAGIPLDGDGDGSPGGDFVRHFAARAGVPQPEGDEFRVHEAFAGDQRTGWELTHPVATDADGNFVVVWASEEPDSSQDVYARIFDAQGNPQDEFVVNPPWAGTDLNPSVAVEPDGDFVVVWQAWSSDGSFTSGTYCRQFDPAGNPKGDPILVSQQGDRPDVAIDGDGDFVVVWEEWWNRDGSGLAVVARLYDGQGNPKGPDFQVNTYKADDQFNPAVAMDGAGNFVIVWASAIQQGTGGVYAQRYDAIGRPQGTEFRIDSYNTKTRQWWSPAVAMVADGDFVVAWSCVEYYEAERDVFVRRFDAHGHDLGAEFRVNTDTVGNQYVSSVSMDAHGGFVVTWSGSDGDVQGVFARRYDGQGEPEGPEFLVNTTTYGQQNNGFAAVAPSGSFVVVWTSDEQDPDGSAGVYAQRFGAPWNLPPSADAGGPYVIYEGAQLELDGSASSDPDEAAGDMIVSYRWDLDNDGQYDDASGQQPVVPWSVLQTLGLAYPANPSNGLPTNMISLEVEDSFGLIGTATTRLTIYAVDANPEVVIPHDPPGPVTVIARREGNNVVVIVEGTGEVLLDRPLDSLRSITLLGADADADTLIVDMDYGGTFTLPDGIHFVGGAGDSDQLAVIHPGGNTNYMLDNTMLAIPEIDLTYDGVEQFDITDLGGDDTYAFSMKNKLTTLHDNDGTDTLDFSGAAKRVLLRMNSVGASQWIDAGNNHLALDGVFEDLIGTLFADQVSGNDADNAISTGAGNDTVSGRAGADVIDTGDGDDVLAGNRHDDLLTAGPGDDVISGGGGPDTLDGGDGNDVLYGFQGHDLIRGGAGMDELIGGDGDDVLVGGDDQDELFGAVGRDVLIGGDGVDSLQGAAGEDVLFGGYTAHDTDDAALKAILAEWRSPRTIDERINYLIEGGGLNASYTLNGSVFDDDLLDTLEGSWSPDWFIVFPTDQFADGEPTPTDRVTYK
jgi:Ca2+-binding RTX toxin-like protein